MAVRLPAPPSDSFRTLTSGLQDIGMAQAGFGLGGAAALYVPSTAQTMPPHPVYELGVGDLAVGKGFDAARIVAWRYLLANDRDPKKGNIVQAAEIVPTAGGCQFGALTTGFARGAEETLLHAEQLPQVQQGNFEFRSIRVPALYLMLLWLKDLQGKDDLFFVIPPAFPPFRPKVVYAAGDILPMLHKQAAEKLRKESNIKLP